MTGSIALITTCDGETAVATAMPDWNAFRTSGVNWSGLYGSTTTFSTTTGKGRGRLHCWCVLEPQHAARRCPSVAHECRAPAATLVTWSISGGRSCPKSSHPQHMSLRRYPDEGLDSLGTGPIAPHVWKAPAAKSTSVVTLSSQAFERSTSAPPSSSPTKDAASSARQTHPTHHCRCRRRAVGAVPALVLDIGVTSTSNWTVDTFHPPHLSSKLW